MASNDPPRELSAPLARLAETLTPLAGRCIALIAPAAGVKDARIDTALAVMHAAGIDARLGKNARAHHRYLAGTTEKRLADLHRAFELPQINAVWCLRGGYGSTHLIEHINWARIPNNVPLIGYSDITALLEAFRRHHRPAIQGPVASELALPGENAGEQAERLASMASLVDLLQGKPGEWRLTHVVGPTSALSGSLIGGNLTTLASLAGTPAALQLDDQAILLLEDVGEAEFRLERYFHQLIDSINTEQLAAICLGRFERCSLADGMHSLVNILVGHLKPLAIPIYSGAPIGHSELNHAWLYANLAEIKNNRLGFGSLRP